MERRETGYTQFLEDMERSAMIWLGIPTCVVLLIGALWFLDWFIETYWAYVLLGTVAVAGIVRLNDRASRMPPTTPGIPADDAQVAKWARQRGETA
jgi:hypothetical protein